MECLSYKGISISLPVNSLVKMLNITGKQADIPNMCLYINSDLFCIEKLCITQVINYASAPCDALHLKTKKI